MKLRSLLFVPGDRPERFNKAAASGADALILDLEDSVSTMAKEQARDAIIRFLNEPAEVARFVRINPLDSIFAREDLAAIVPAAPDGIMLPKCEGARDLRALDQALTGSTVSILPIATETPSAIFKMGEYGGVTERLIGLTWGAEDLPAAIGARTSRDENGLYTAPYEMARSLTLFGAHAANVSAIETVFPAFRDQAGLAAYAARAMRDGFSGMMAIHPSQVPIINAAFDYSADDVMEASALLAAAEAANGAGAFQYRGRMIDAPHLKLARRIVEFGRTS